MQWLLQCCARGLPQSTLQPLQRVQNAAARLVSDTKPHLHYLRYLYFRLYICVNVSTARTGFYGVANAYVSGTTGNLISRRIANRGVDKLAVVETSARLSVRLSNFLVGSSDAMKGFGFDR